jgi:hypothetical protein
MRALNASTHFPYFTVLIINGAPKVADVGKVLFVDQLR